MPAVEPDRLVTLDAAIPARRWRVGLLCTLPAPAPQAVLCTGLCRTVPNSFVPPPVESILARALLAVPREVAGAGSRLAQ